jgi:stearoyl-CoA desaturase (Delta-9 desaturase)
MFVWKHAEEFGIQYNYIFISIAFCYVPFILGLKMFMKNKIKCNLDKILMVWNYSMSVLSFIGFFILLPYLTDKTLLQSLSSLDYLHGKTGMTVFFFDLSKIPELLDTVFIVLRKKKLTFLHTFHHLVTAIYCWSTFFYPTPLGFWYSTMNLGVHGIMYGYYAANYFDIKIIPLLYLKSLKIIQLFYFLSLNMLYLIINPSYDSLSIYNTLFGISMYGGLLYLFCKDFSYNYKFKTEINWISCFYLLSAHIIALIGIFRIDSWFTFLETIVISQFTAIGITAGAHRLWSHKSYKAKTPTRFLLMILASICNQGSIFHWCRDHRTHHKFSDTDGDPHNINRGFFYSHIGWLLLKKDISVIEAGNKLPNNDLLQDWVVKINYDLNPFWDQFWCFIVPGIYGIWRFNSFWDGFILFGVLRWVIVLHMTWCINSVAHTFGYRPYKDIPPVESFWAAVAAVGEGWHNWHHTYPYDYATAEKGALMRWNPTKVFIDILWLFGQTYDHKRKIIKKTIQSDDTYKK